MIVNNWKERINEAMKNNTIDYDQAQELIFIIDRVDENLLQFLFNNPNIGADSITEICSKYEGNNKHKSDVVISVLTRYMNHLNGKPADFDKCCMLAYHADKYLSIDDLEWYIKNDHIVGKAARLIMNTLIAGLNHIKMNAIFGDMSRFNIGQINQLCISMEHMEKGLIEYAIVKEYARPEVKASSMRSIRNSVERAGLCLKAAVSELRRYKSPAHLSVAFVNKKDCQ